MKIKLLLVMVLVVLVGGIFLSSKNTRNWLFYSKQSIGANNKLSLYDNLNFDEKIIYLNSQDKKTYALNRNSGQVTWQFQAQEYSPFPPTIDSEQVFLSNFDGNIYSLDKKTGYKNWQFNLENSSLPDTPVITNNQSSLLYFASRHGTLYALDKVSGQMVWKKQFQTIDTNKVFATGSIHFGSIYLDAQQIYLLSSIEKKMFALDQLSGKINWQIENIDFSFEEPIFLDQEIILKKNDSLLKINKIDGNITKINRQGNENTIWQILKVENDNKHLLIIDDKTLTKIDSDLNKVEWQIENIIDDVLYKKNRIKPAEIKVVNNKILAQKHIYLENSDVLVAINYQSGQTIWEKPISSWVINQEFDDSTAYLGGLNGDLTALDIENGQIKWQTGNDGRNSKIFVINHNPLMVNEKAGNKVLLKYFTNDGHEIWQYTPNSTVEDIAEVYQYQGSIFILAEKRKLVEAIKIKVAAPDKRASKKINFFYQENKTNHDPFLEIKEKDALGWWWQEKTLKFNYVLKNLAQVTRFKLKEEEKSGIFEITINHDEQLYQNRFTNLKITAIFSKQDTKEKIKVQGFYFDHNSWKIRFIAPKPGKYDYKIKMSSPYLISKTFTGTIDLQNFKNEKIEIIDNNFTINRQQLFFPIGIQDAFFDRNYNGNYTEEMPDSSLNQPSNDKQKYAYKNLSDYLDMYQNQANINIFRYGVENWTPALWQSIDWKDFSLSVNGGKFGDELVKQLKARNFKIIMTIFGFYPPYKSREEITVTNNQQALQAYLDYVMARFGPYVDLWEINNEAEADKKWYEFVIGYIRKNDPYQHPISTNWETAAASNLDFLSVHWYNPNRMSTGWLSGDISYLDKKYQQYQKPVLISEFGLKGQSWFENSADNMRVLTWLSIFRKMGVIFWTNGQNGIYENQNNANIYLGPIERSFLFNLQQFLPKKMILPVENSSLLIPELQTQAYLLKNQDFILIYLLKVDQSKNQSTELELNLAKPAKIQWFSPQTNSLLMADQKAAGPQKITIPNFTTDLAIKIEYLR